MCCRAPRSIIMREANKSFKSASPALPTKLVGPTMVGGTSLERPYRQQCGCSSQAS